MPPNPAPAPLINDLNPQPTPMYLDLSLTLHLPPPHTPSAPLSEHFMPEEEFFKDKDARTISIDFFLLVFDADQRALPGIRPLLFF